MAAQNVALTLPDGSVKEVQAGTTVRDAISVLPRPSVSSLTTSRNSSLQLKLSRSNETAER